MAVQRKIIKEIDPFNYDNFFAGNVNNFDKCLWNNITVEYPLYNHTLSIQPSFTVCIPFWNDFSNN